MKPFVARARYYGPDGELLVIAITAGDPPVATCVAADGELLAIGVTDLRALLRSVDWPVTESSEFVGEPRPTEAIG